MRAVLGKKAIRAIHKAVEGLFNRAKARFLGRDYGPKEIRIGSKTPSKPHREDLSLPGIFNAAARIERMTPNDRLRESLSRVAEGYLDAHKEATKSRVVNSVQSFLAEAEQKGVDTDVETILGGELAEVFGKVTQDVKKIFESESTKARNVSTIDVVQKTSAIMGESDPVVYFVVVRDGNRCEECTRLHLLEDKMTPRVWRLSELGHGYHKRGDEKPKVGGLHPNCRCTLVVLAPGFGFRAGSVVYIGPDHDEFKKQRV